MQQGGTIGKMWPVRPLQVNEFLKKIQVYVWYHDDISLDDNRLVGSFQFGTSGKNKLKQPNTIKEKALEE